MKNKGLRVVILVALLLLVVMLTDTWLLFSQTREQTRQSGSYQLESVSGKLESTINDAKLLTMEEAVNAREYLADTDAVTDYIYSERDRVVSRNPGALNVYIANDDYIIIPDFDIPDDFILEERVWYGGALRNYGKPYVSSPYLDVITGNMCYTVSVMLTDERTVVAIDYTMDNIQKYIGEMAEDAVSAVIVTDEGIIAGCSDESFIGKKLIDALPECAGIYTSAKNSDDVVTGRVRSDIFYENLFATRSGNGWYMIVGIDEFKMYRNSYIQLFATLLMSLALFAVIITLYSASIRSRRNAEDALASREDFLSRITGELAEPLQKILDRSGRKNVMMTDDYETDMASIHSAGEHLSDMINQIISYRNLTQPGDTSPEGDMKPRKISLDMRSRTIILLIMILAMLLSLYINVFSALRWGNTSMQKETAEYEYKLSEWIDSQKSILDMFVSVISTNPQMLDDYEGTVGYLDRITQQYPEISATYMTNPDLPHTVYMNNGWEPSSDWHVEERQWYVDTLSSDQGWSMSSPYYDERTGGYCVTLSEIVYDHETGEFLGIFGIDFFMDKLINILGDSYSEKGYAFLVDSGGMIINHPYGAYQMSLDHETPVTDLPFGNMEVDGSASEYFRDYDETRKICLATRDAASGFTVYVVYDAWDMYGQVVVVSLISIIASLTFIILTYRILTSFIRLQEETNRKLTDAADKAIAAGNAKSTFLAQMSHEIRTPINAVLGMNEMILRETDNNEIREYAENIQSAGRTLLSLINSILDFSKIEDGKMELVPAKYDVCVVVNDLANSIMERAKTKGLEFELDIDPNLPCALYGDDVRIRQVIMNLLTNAVKYTNEGKVTLSVSVRERNGDSLVMSVSVRDTGIGIHKEDMDKLFESFARLDEEKNRNIEGTGLGMSIVAGLLDMMGTTLDVESEYGKGSVFSFDLTQKIMDPAPIGDFTHRIHTKTEADGKENYIYAPDASVLIVDDSSMNRRVAKALMKRNGIVPDEAASGREAIDKMSQKSYDIVFLDHMMPEMDGIDTLKILQDRNLIPKGCAVIALTANAVSGAREFYMESGFDDYLSKPIEVAQLENKLALWLPAAKPHSS